MAEIKTYKQIVETYRRRRQETVVDTIASGLTYADEVAVQAGVLEETGIITDTAEVISGALPFVIIAIDEGGKVLMRRKEPFRGLKDSAFRMAKTGAAMGIGAAVYAAGGVWAALPATMGVRALFDRYKSAALTSHRVQGRTERLRELNRLIRQGMNEE